MSKPSARSELLQPQLDSCDFLVRMIRASTDPSHRREGRYFSRINEAACAAIGEADPDRKLQAIVAVAALARNWYLATLGEVRAARPAAEEGAA